MSDTPEQFDGQDIAGYLAVLPTIKLEAPDSWQRGTYINLNVAVRVRSVRYEEVGTGKHKGDLNKVHVLAMEEVGIASVVTPAERRAILEAELKALEEAEQKQIEDVTDVTHLQDPDWEYDVPEYAQPSEETPDVRDEDESPLDETARQAESVTF